MYTVRGSYYLDVRCGGVQMSLEPAGVRTFCIIQDMNRFLPSFEAEFLDNGGMMTHVTPSDDTVNGWDVDITDDKLTVLNGFKFKVFRKFPDGMTPSSATYKFAGLLDTEAGFLTRELSRSLSGTVQSILETIAGEAGIDTVEMSPSLKKSTVVIQPDWTNNQLLTYMKQNLVGLNGEVGYYCFVKKYKGTSVLVFKTIEEMINTKAAKQYYCGVIGTADTPLILDYAVMENHILAELAPSVQRYGYFDYDTGQYVAKELSFAGVSLTDKLGFEKAESQGNFFADTGRTNDFGGDFSGLVGSSQYRRAYSLVKMWISVEGAPNLVPGDTLQLIFGTSVAAMFNMQYSGYWAVERVAHNFGETFTTKVLLTRNGLDTSLRTSLQVATKRKKQ